MATTLRTRFKESDEDLRRIFTMDEDLLELPLETALRILVDGLKESPHELEILIEGDLWIEELNRRIAQADSEAHRDRLLHGVELIRASRTLAEIAVEELASEEHGYTCSLEEEAEAHSLRKELLLKLIADSPQG